MTSTFSLTGIRCIFSHARIQGHKFQLRTRKNTTQVYNSAEESSQSPQSSQESSVSKDAVVEEKQASLPFTASEFFGSYLQLAVWIVVLSLAFYAGMSRLKSDPGSAGLFLAPPSAALFLIVTFLFYRIVIQGKDDEEQ
eukprot:TRINITY_DN1829_c0_g1_i1.p2 TRINITY_DN1829_c0_g1~~TRINITY_DN1829_c0_g1_i1.p2  ORF type:complete len:159 (+),score=10.59 TRINITY_DN1829_c0_g1_i1:63-479(+)